MLSGVAGWRDAIAAGRRCHCECAQRQVLLQHRQPQLCSQLRPSAHRSHQLRTVHGHSLRPKRSQLKAVQRADYDVAKDASGAQRQDM